MYRSAKLLLPLLVFLFVLGLTMPVLADANQDKTEGRIKSITVNKSEFVMTDDKGKDWTMYLDTKGKVMVNDKDAQFSELREGDQCRITYLKQGTKLIATKIACKRK
jgi:hypothetical protein